MDAKKQMTSPRRAPRPTPRHRTETTDQPSPDGRPNLKLLQGGSGDKPGGPTRPTREQALRRRAVAGFGGFLVLALLAAGANALRSDGEAEPLMRNSSPAIEAVQEQENAIVRALMESGGKIDAPIKVEGGTLSQKQGLTRIRLDEKNATMKLRNQPAVIRDETIEGKFTSNAALELGDIGLSQINEKAGESDTADFYRAYQFVTDDGGLWVGGVVSREGKDATYDTPEALAEDLVWFSVGETQNDIHSGVVITQLPDYVGATQPTVSVAGQEFSTKATVRYYDSGQWS